MDNTRSFFFELLQVAVGNRCRLSRILTTDEWHRLYEACMRQSLMGVGFVAMQHLPEEQWPARGQVLTWAAVANKIKQHNVLANSECVTLCRQLKADGFECCILKGQSNLAYYPELLSGYRLPGDIDILIRSSRADRTNIRKCVDYCIQQARISGGTQPRVYYHHADFDWHGKIDVEAHYRATWLNSPFTNMRLQRWLADDNQWAVRPLMTGEGEIYVPSTEFDAVYQLLHIYKHLFESGIGLRQVMDYYFVLLALKRESSDAPAAQEKAMLLLRRFGMKRFAGAMMWVLATVFEDGKNDDIIDKQRVVENRKPWMLCEPDEKEGRFLLKEIMMAGNFGKYDARLSQPKSQSGRAYEKMRRNTWFITHYPDEVVCKPLFMVYHLVWRKLQLWKLQ